MTAPEIVAKAGRAGLKLTLNHEKLAIQGSGTRPQHLLEEIRRRKAEIVLFLESKRSPCNEESEGSERSSVEANKTSSLSLPSLSLPLPATMPVLDPDERERVIGQIMELGKEAIGWCMVRANAYFEEFPGSTFESQDAAAALDFLRSRTPGKMQ
jgi:hypothetical protein